MAVKAHRASQREKTSEDSVSMHHKIDMVQITDDVPSLQFTLSIYISRISTPPAL